MLIGIGFGLIYILFGKIIPENMQFEGFWFWLLAGSFAASVLHYLIAKIVGPSLFNRGWCGWACWTAAILALSPWNQKSGRIKKLEKIKYIHFTILTIIIFILVLLFNYNLQTIHGTILLADQSITTLFHIPSFWWFLIGNLSYYTSGITLAFFLKDNRAFCKYLCPIACFLKIGASKSILRIEGNKEKCIL